jgi:hypothetical protein
MTLPSPVAYTSNLSRKGALLDETLVVLAQIQAGDSLETVRARILDEDLLHKTTRSTREAVWKVIRAQYLQNDGILSPLARMVTRSQQHATARLVLFYEFCQSEPLLRDTTLHCIYPRYLAGFSGVSKPDIQKFFDDLTPEHPEIADWSPQTRGKVVSNILSILRDFGLLEGTQRKTFARLYVPLPAFVYVLYRLRDEGLEAALAIVGADAWRLFLLEREDVLNLLEECTAEGHCIFKHRGDVMDLEWVYSNLEACVEAITGEA